MRNAEAEAVATEAIDEVFEPEAIDHDDSLIRWMLDLSPTQRLAAAQGFIDSVRVLQNGRRGPVSRHSQRPGSA